MTQHPIPTEWYTVVDANGNPIGYGRNSVLENVRRFVESCNRDEWPGKADAALPFRVVRDYVTS